MKEYTKDTPLEGKYPALVEWIDCVGHHGWHCPAEEPDAPIRCVNVGFIVERTRKHVRVSAGASESGQVDSCIVIPRANVKKIVPLIQK